MRLSLLATFFINAFAQNPLPQFEIATVKSPGPQDRIITLYNYPGGRVVINLYTFALLLHEALGVQRFQVVGAPAWIDSERFMIEAKPPASSKLSSFRPSNPEAPLVEEQRQMLLALLMDRFQLKFHRESKGRVSAQQRTQGAEVRAAEAPGISDVLRRARRRKRNGVRWKRDDGVHRFATQSVNRRSGARSNGADWTIRFRAGARLRSGRARPSDDFPEDRKRVGTEA